MSQEYATVLSPSRATLVEVSSKRSSTCSIDARTTSTPATDITASRAICPSFEVPVTPPSSPHRTFINTDSARKTVAFSKNNATGGVTAYGVGDHFTPPQTPEEAFSSRRSVSDAGLRSVLSMLEQSIAQFPSSLLNMDSPVTDHVRTYKKSLHFKNSSQQPHSSLGGPHSASTSQSIAGVASKNATSAKGVTDLRWFRGILGSSSDTLASGLYAHILSVNFLDDLLDHDFSSNKPCTERASSSCHSPSRSPSPSTHRRYARTTEEETRSVRHGLLLCLRRLLESLVGVNQSSEVLLRSLMAVVRLAEV